MTKYFCDRCGFEISAAETILEVTASLVGIRPDLKRLCRPCFEMWRETITRFFAKQGQ